MTAAPGSPTTFEFTITNEASSETLGSITITKPAPLTITGANLAGGGSVSFTETRVLIATATLAPGAETSFTVSTTSSCAPATYQWGVQGKQSSDVSGTDNTFSIATTTATAVTGKITGGCSVAFVPTNEPKSTIRTAVILNGFASTGAPVEAGVYTPSGALATAFTGTITVTLSRNPTGAKLSGASSVTAPVSDGIAIFPALSVDLVGTGYRLKATSPGLTTPPPSGLSPISPLFSIYTKLAQCSTADCSASGSTTTNNKTRVTLTETTKSAPEGGFVGVGFGGAPTFASGCGGTYLVTAADTASTDVFFATGTATSQSRTATWRIVYEITKTIVKSSGQMGASEWQVCYASTTEFKTSSGATASAESFSTGTTGTSVAYFVGLLPSCSAKHAVAPCIQTRHKDNAGDEYLAIRAAGDSFVRP